MRSGPLRKKYWSVLRGRFSEMEGILILLDILHLKCIISTNKEIYYGPELYRENVGADHQKGCC
jgi:hypothetical protein